MEADASGREKAQEESGPARSLLVCFLGAEGFAVDLAHVCKVLRPSRIARVSGAAPEVLGLMNCQGEVLCVLDLRRVLSPRKETAPPEGTTLGREGVEAMAQIKERVGDIARKTLFLGEKSHEIGKVMEIIKEIASEIHLLALNAAIESAAAGEHGWRFAVVASEVRRLAEKTRESTETIRLLSEAFSEIIGTIERTSEESTQISLATHQQTSANEQVVQAMRQIEEMVRVTASKMKESSASASQLREMAGTLQEKAAVFHV